MCKGIFVSLMQTGGLRGGKEGDEIGSLRVIIEKLVKCCLCYGVGLLKNGID